MALLLCSFVCVSCAAVCALACLLPSSVSRAVSSSVRVSVCVRVLSRVMQKAVRLFPLQISSQPAPALVHPTPSLHLISYAVTVSSRSPSSRGNPMNSHTTYALNPEPPRAGLQCHAPAPITHSYTETLIQMCACASVHVPASTYAEMRSDN